MAGLTVDVQAQIDSVVTAYSGAVSHFEADASILQTRLLAHPELKKLVHSIKWRAKDPAHLQNKLIRKAEGAAKEGRKFDIDVGNMFDLLSDLAGVRLLHLHMKQIEQIHPLLIRIFNDEGYVLCGSPEAKTWDLEYEQIFKQLDLKVERNESLYTSVHYVVKQNSTNPRKCELQVRTLAEEVWGETSHRINYPHETDSVACKEQLKVLARIVSGCTRLVDSIVASYDDHRRRAHD